MQDVTSDLDKPTCDELRQSTREGVTEIDNLPLIRRESRVVSHAPRSTASSTCSPPQLDKPTNNLLRPYRPSDKRKMREAIDRLYDLGIRVFRPKSNFQLKYKDLNFYPSTGKITRDSSPPMKEWGLDAFIRIVQAEKAVADSARRQRPTDADRFARFNDTKLDDKPSLEITM